jgi:putative hemin transport protein
LSAVVCLFRNHWDRVDVATPRSVAVLIRSSITLAHRGRRDPAGLGAVWRAHRLANPEMQTYDAAVDLGVSEAELVATACGRSATRLRTDWPHLVAALQGLGCVAVQSRNGNAVHTITGRYGETADWGSSRDLRYSFHRWSSGFAITEGSRRSLQFFDPHGTAVHKVNLTADSKTEAYDALVADFGHDDQRRGQDVEPRRPDPWRLLDAQVDVAALTSRWHDLEAENAFDAMLQAARVGHIQALRLVPDGLASAVANDAPRRVFDTAIANATPIRLTVANEGVAQTWFGPIHRVQIAGPWLRVLGPNLNLGLREAAVDSVWIVRKPPRVGIVSVLELFDASEQRVCEISGVDSGQGMDDPAWRYVLAAIQGLGGT